MTRTLRAHFDGKVIVPEEPVDLPVGQSLSVQIESREQSRSTARLDAPAENPFAALIDWVKKLPPAGDDVPTDLAAQHDHYLYGTPKRP